MQAQEAEWRREEVAMREEMRLLQEDLRRHGADCEHEQPSAAAANNNTWRFHQEASSSPRVSTPMPFPNGVPGGSPSPEQRSPSEFEDEDEVSERIRKQIEDWKRSILEDEC